MGLPGLSDAAKSENTADDEKAANQGDGACRKEEAERMILTTVFLSTDQFSTREGKTGLNGLVKDRQIVLTRQGWGRHERPL